MLFHTDEKYAWKEGIEMNPLIPFVPESEKVYIV